MPKGAYVRHCGVCLHPDRARIEITCAESYVSKTLRGSAQSIGEKFGVSRHIIRCHWEKHVTPQRKTELLGGPVAIAQMANKAAEESRSVLDYLSILRGDLFRLFIDARKKGQVFEAAVVAGRLITVLEKLGALSGELRQASGITINNLTQMASVNGIKASNDPEAGRVVSVIIKALRKHPAARGDVLAALDEIGAAPAFLIGNPNGQIPPPVTIEGRAND